ncbi:MAG: sigma-70 family RNA polymerase sigma factor [Candidatus Peribacteria bacterium]|nr:MAG: sigma-70 family RNA polymerase sigma factor [Candidatus Peribacteria bacterium]
MFKFDKKTIRRIQRQDSEAYHLFYEGTVHVFYRYLSAHYFLTRPEMDDLLSEFYLKFWQVAAKYDDHFKFESFVRTVFKNLVKDYFKKAKE